MASDLLLIGKSGTVAARRSLELTAQNIANADNPDYARRRISQTEVVSPTGVAGFFETNYSGVRIDGIQRTDAIFLQNEARRTSADVARADAELAGIRNAEAAIEQTGIFPAIVDFEASLARLQSDPLDGALRAAALESGRALAETLNIADGALNQASEQVRFEAQAGVDEVNSAAGELARLNAQIVRADQGTAGFAALLDQRDGQLARLAQQTGISVAYASDGRVDVRIGDGSGPLLVSGTDARIFATSTNPDGTIGFALDGAAVVPANGQLAGQSQALIAQRDLSVRLDDLARLTIQIANDARANGAALDGSAGQPFYSGTGASDIEVVLADGAGIATAPAGSGANSLNTSNLEAWRGALANNGPAASADSLIFDLANAVRTRTVTRDSLEVIAQSAETALAAETGVDLEEEALNLVRFQQAFQASSRVIQTASDLFDTILGIR